MIHARIASLALFLSLGLTASAQIAADAGPDQSTVYPAPADLHGVVQNGTALEWWTADGNGVDEDKLVRIGANGVTAAIGPLRGSAGLVYGFPGDLVKIGGVYYGVESARRILYRLDPETGTCTPVGPAYSTQWANVFSLAYDAVHNKLFGVDLVKKQLLLFNRTNGKATVVGAGTLKGYPLVRSLAYNPADDRLYANDQQTDLLLKIHPTTGLVSRVVTMTPDPNARIEELEFIDGNLYASNGLLTNGVLTGGELQLVDLVSGTARRVGPLVDQLSPHCLMIQSLPEQAQWFAIDGPGVVTFGDDKTLDTSVSFSAPGTYVLELRVYTSTGPVTDTVSIVAEG